MSAANGKRWASPFPPTNSADERRYDDVTLAAPKARGVAGLGGNWLLLEEDKSESTASFARKDGGQLRFGDGADHLDGDRDFELNTGGGRVIFSLVPRAPWPGGDIPAPPAARGFDRLDGSCSGVGGNGGSDGNYMYQRRRQQPSAVLHRVVHTRPLVSDAAGQHPEAQFPSWHHQLPAAGTTVSAPAGPGCSSSGDRAASGGKGFSLRRLLHIKPSSRRSVSRSRSSASASASALTANTTTPTPQSRSRAPSAGGAAVNGKSAHAYKHADTKIYHQPHQHQQLQNGFSSAGGPSAVRSRYSADATLGSRNQSQPAPDY